MGVSNSDVPFTTPNSGFIGLEPYTRDMNAKSKNFMYQLKERNLISQNVVSIYTANSPSGNSSIVKFGGWDK